MIGVGFRHKKMIRLEASYDNSELETAVALGESLVHHNRGEVVVFLYDKGKPKAKVKVLKRIKAVRSGFLGLKRRVVVQ